MQESVQLPLPLEASPRPDLADETRDAIVDVFARLLLQVVAAERETEVGDES